MQLQYVRYIVKQASLLIASESLQRSLLTEMSVPTLTRHHKFTIMPSNHRSSSPPWRNSEAKKQLLLALEDPSFSCMSNEDIYSMIPELAYTNWDLFPARLARAKQQTKKKIDRASADKSALLHDRALVPVAQVSARGYPRWEGSAAQHQLNAHIDAGAHTTAAPNQLFASTQSYEPFGNNVVRKHIYQEVKSRKFIAQMKEKNEKKKKQKK
jgi:hypothetical protein